MTPAENIYRSDDDMVDGLVDVEGYDDGHYIEDDQYDDGQPDLMQECDDLYGYGPEWDCYHDCLEYPEDWGQNGNIVCGDLNWNSNIRIPKK